MTISNISASFQETHMTRLDTAQMWKQRKTSSSKKKRKIKTYRYLVLISRVDALIRTLLSRRINECRNRVWETEKSFKQIMLGHTWDSNVFSVDARANSNVNVRAYVVFVCVYCMCGNRIFSFKKIFCACINNRWGKYRNNAHRIVYIWEGC